LLKIDQLSSLLLSFTPSNTLLVANIKSDFVNL
jgi:hypothetical protein